MFINNGKNIHKGVIVHEYSQQFDRPIRCKQINNKASSHVKGNIQSIIACVQIKTSIHKRCNIFF